MRAQIPGLAALRLTERRVWLDLRKRASERSSQGSQRRGLLKRCMRLDQREQASKRACEHVVSVCVQIPGLAALRLVERCVRLDLHECACKHAWERVG
eukprot:365592-Chlamydomonas_euryale.AAC.1